jgi:hydrogenase expression/formation protein HypE
MTDKVLLAHGSGGKLAHELILAHFLRALHNPVLSQLDDSAVLETAGRLAFTTDT